MQKYKQLTLEQRYGINLMLKQGFNMVEISKEIGFHKSTISREIRRNCGKRGYRYKQANEFANRRKQGKSQIKIDSNTWAFIEQLIKLDWSPEQINGLMKINMPITVSHERIYQYIDQDKQNGGNLYTHLRCRKKRKKCYGSNDKRGNLKNRISIENRPSIVEDRSRVGDWEADTIIGKAHKQAIVSLTERKSGFALIYKVDRRTKDNTEYAIKHLFGSISEKV